MGAAGSSFTHTYQRDRKLAAIDEKIQATRFIRHTPLAFEWLRVLGQEAAAAASGTLTKVKETEVDAGSLIQYTVQRAGFFDVLSFGLIFNEANGDALNTVILQPGPYITSQAGAVHSHRAEGLSRLPAPEEVLRAPAGGFVVGRRKGRVVPPGRNVKSGYPAIHRRARKRGSCPKLTLDDAVNIDSDWLL